MLKIYLSGDTRSFWQDIVVGKGPDWPGIIYFDPRELKSHTWLSQREIEERRIEKLNECDVVFAYCGEDSSYIDDKELCHLISADVFRVKMYGSGPNAHVILVDAKQDDQSYERDFRGLERCIDFKTDSLESAINHLYTLALAEAKKIEGSE